MTLRRRVAVVFVLATLLTLGVLIVSVIIPTAKIRRELNSERARVSDRTATLIGGTVRQRIEAQLASTIQTRMANSVRQAIAIGEWQFWDDALVRDNVTKVLLVNYTDVETLLYNPRPHLIFEEFDGQALDPNAVRELISSTQHIEIARAAGGMRLVYGRVRSDRKGVWGFCFRLREESDIEFNPARWVVGVLGLAVPALLLLSLVFYRFFQRGVLQPLAATEHAALRITRGRYDQLLPFDHSRDEIGNVARAMNLMMAELQRFRDHMEGLVEDSNERFKKAERHLVVAQRLAAMGHLAAGIAHEINNPLAGTLNAVQKLGEPDLAPERREKYRRLAREAIERIQATVQKVLATSPRVVEVGPVLLAEVLEHTEGLMAHRLKSEGVVLELSLPQDCAVVGDRNEVVQVFMNLMINACDAMEGGGKICIEARNLDEDVEIKIRDNGPGMTEELQKSVFDLFFTTKPGNKGTGLGLGIVHNIVTGHGGTIALQSQPGSGSEFTITLPRV